MAACQRGRGLRRIAFALLTRGNSKKEQERQTVLYPSIHLAFLSAQVPNETSQLVNERARRREERELVVHLQGTTADDTCILTL